MIFNLRNATNAVLAEIPARCPSCRQNGVFRTFPNVPDLWDGALNKGFLQRFCPNFTCRAHLFLVTDGQGNIITRYPSEKIDFDSVNIPEKILKTFDEALTCHSEHCYTAAAIMIRRTLEELCNDKGAEGKNLQQRIATLEKTIVLPKELFSAMDALRLLGNDAAHLDAKTYDDVGENELLIAITLTKEILKAVYQYQSLLSDLLNLKKENS